MNTWRFNTCVNQSLTPQLAYIDGYREAAKILMEQALTGDENIDTLVYPILFLYRHFFELALKEIILVSSHFLAAIPRDLDLSNTHDLRQLWRHAKECLTKAWPTCVDDLAPIDKCVDFFINHGDTHSLAGRYSGKNGKPYIPEEIKSISLSRMYEIMEAGVPLLDGALMGIDDMHQNYVDYRSSCDPQE